MPTMRYGSLVIRFVRVLHVAPLNFRYVRVYSYLLKPADLYEYNLIAVE